MIGFKMNASGSHNFKWSREAWTEGDLWIGKALKVVPKSPESKVSDALVGGIENEFKKLGKAVFWRDIVNIGLDLQLTVTGDINFIYQFRASKPGSQIASDFLQILAGQSNEMGDQVMIYLANCFKQFSLHVVFQDQSDLKLKVDIDL